MTPIFRFLGGFFSLLVLLLHLSCTHRGLTTQKHPNPPLAVIGDRAITETEFELYNQTLPRERQVAVSEDLHERRNAFEEFLGKRLYSLAAQESGHPALDSLRRRVGLLDQQVITQFYQLVFIGENLGKTRKEIEAYYHQNPEKFRDSSGRIPPVHEILTVVSDTMVLAEVDLDSFYRANSANYSPELPNLWQKLGENYLFENKRDRSENAVAKLKSKYGAKVVHNFRNPTEEEVVKYYHDNRDNYLSADGFELYHIEVSNTKALGPKVSATKSLEEFKALATRFSENPWTKGQGGKVGLVKRDHCLPYGIGMLPTLYPLLDEIKGGRITTEVQNQVTGKWHYFWLVQKFPSSIKPLDRVKNLVKQDILTNRVTQFHPDDTLAVIPGRRVILDKETNFLRDEIPEQLRKAFTRESLADFLIEREIVAAEAESLGLLNDDRLKASRLENELTFWSRFYEDTLLSPSWNKDSVTLANLFAQKPHAFTNDSQQTDWRPFARDLAAYPLITPKELEIEYHTNRELYLRGDSLPPFAEVEGMVFHNLKIEAYRRLDAKRVADLKAHYQVRINPSFEEPTFEPVDKVLQEAKDFYRNRKPNQALYLYRKLREKFPTRDELQYAVGLGLAQIHLEQKRYQQALAEYRRLSLLYPKHPDNFKALFMEGVILAEHFKSDSAAVRTFESMLKEYPTSPLAKEADWMIRNIRSGGALVPDLRDGN